MEKITTNTFEETQNVGAKFAQQILRENLGKQAVVLALRGDLGAGKTTFLQGFAKGLGIDEVVNSPTFVIMKSFKLQDLSFKMFYHFDLYRLETEKDVEFLDFQKIISDSQNIIAIEWPEKISGILPKNSISIHFTHIEEGRRTIEIQ